MPAEAFPRPVATPSRRRPASWAALVKNRRKNGDHYWVRANITPILRDGTPVGYMSVRTPAHRAKQVAGGTTPCTPKCAPRAADQGPGRPHTAPRAPCNAKGFAGRLVAAAAAPPPRRAWRLARRPDGHRWPPWPGTALVPGLAPRRGGGCHGRRGAAGHRGIGPGWHAPSPLHRLTAAAAPRAASVACGRPCSRSRPAHRVPAAASAMLQRALNQARR
jgi:hypothetical protein